MCHRSLIFKLLHENLGILHLLTMLSVSRSSLKECVPLRGKNYHTKNIPPLKTKHPEAKIIY